MTTALPQEAQRQSIRQLPRVVLRGGLLTVGIPIAVVGTLLQAVGFVAFTAAENVETKAHR